MRRKDREITDVDEMTAVIKQCDCLNLALFDEEYPYVVPLNFGFKEENGRFTFYFHGSGAGKKLRLIQQNDHAAFTMSCGCELMTGEKSCDYSMRYKSICGRGRISMLEGEEKRRALDKLMLQYGSCGDQVYGEKELNSVAVYKLEVSRITGKQRK